MLEATSSGSALNSFFSEQLGRIRRPELNLIVYQLNVVPPKLKGISVSQKELELPQE